MSDITLEVPELHPAQEQVRAEARRFNVVDCGRRFGKTQLGEDVLVEVVAEGAPAGWFSPTYKMLAEVWRDMSQVLRPIIARSNVQEHRLELVTGGVVDMWSLDSADTVRGRKYRRAVIDEAALVPNLMDTFNAVIRPTLVDYQGDAYFLSTPKGHNGFWQMWVRGQDPDETEWRSWQFPSGANPYIPVSEIDAMRRTMPERIFQQEVEARFLDDAGGVFRRVVEAAMAQPAEPEPERQYVFGVDWGKQSDFTVISVLDVGARRMVAMDRFNQIDYRVQRQRLGALAERYRPAVILAETNSIGEPIIEQLRADGLPVQGFTTTNATKTQAIEALALAFEQGGIQIMNDPVLVGELQAYEMERLPSGMMRYNAPEGMHDDCVMSLALAWCAVATPGGSELIAF